MYLQEEKITASIQIKKFKYGLECSAVPVTYKPITYLYVILY